MEASYQAFRARALADLNAQHTRSGCASFRQQQALLRVHLRHLLLANSAPESDPAHAASACLHGVGHGSGFRDSGFSGSGAAWMNRIRRSVAAAAVETTQRDEQPAARKRQERAATRAPATARHEGSGIGQGAATRVPRPSTFHAQREDAVHGEAFLVRNDDGGVNLDLSSTSQFVPLHEQLRHEADSLSFDVTADASDTQRARELEHSSERKEDAITEAKCRSLHMFELVVELLSARDLAIPAASSATRVHIGAELSLMHQAARIAVLSAGPTAFIAAIDDAAHWDNATLRFGFDSTETSGELCCYDPQSVINEWSLSVLVTLADAHPDAAVSAQSGALGKIEVPLVLLDTPLAQEYAMARWFPLERMGVGVPTRGDVRVAITLSMRDDSSHDRPTMVAYKPNESQNLSSSGNAATALKKKKKSSSAVRRPVKKTPSATTSSAKPSVSSNGGASPRRGSRSTPQSRDQQLHDRSADRRPPPPLLRPKPIQPVSPGHRRPKVEAFSPPSSPSSFSSENMDEPSVPAARSPRSPLHQGARRRSSTSSMGGKQRAADSVGDTGDAAAAAEGADSSASSQPTFLKRKPYKVVFRKLDWSSVASRTDSSWDAKNPPGTQAAGSSAGAGVPGGAAAGVASGSKSPNGSAVSKARSKQAVSTSQGKKACTSKKASAVELSPGMRARLETLSSAIYECCQVTQATAPLAQMKYHSERNKIVQQQQQQQAQGAASGQEPANSNAPDSADQPHHSEAHDSIALSQSALSVLWKALVKDAAGELYAKKLRELLPSAEICPQPADI